MTDPRPLVELLAEHPIFAGLAPEHLQWFADHSDDLRLEADELVIQDGDPADHMLVVLTGEIHGRRESDIDWPAFIVKAGEVTGMLPFSRMTHFQATARAVVPTRGARMHKNLFPELQANIPELLPRLVGVLTDRVREVSRSDVQHEKLMALGKLSAGLAHELNNPAAAARRASETLRETMTCLRETNLRLNVVSLTDEQRAVIDRTETEAIERLRSATLLDSLELSDREQEVATWLEGRGVAQAWELAGGLAEAGLDQKALAAFGGHFENDLLADVLGRFVGVVTVERLVREIEGSTCRISELVKAVKEYSYMDKTPEQETDIHKGLETTLTMLKFRLKNGITIVREYAPDLPLVHAHGGELNQVWTNLIDNAADAMKGQGRLVLRTRREYDRVVIEVVDSGSGIPPEIKDRIFEPFFTTKDQGEGTGLGLDTVHRIIRRHHGEIRVESVPGETKFTIWLPIHQPKEAA